MSKVLIKDNDIPLSCNAITLKVRQELHYFPQQLPTKLYMKIQFVLSKDSTFFITHTNIMCVSLPDCVLMYHLVQHYMILSNTTRRQHRWTNQIWPENNQSQCDSHSNREKTMISNQQMTLTETVKEDPDFKSINYTDWKQIMISNSINYTINTWFTSCDWTPWQLGNITRHILTSVANNFSYEHLYIHTISCPRNT